MIASAALHSAASDPLDRLRGGVRGGIAAYRDMRASRFRQRLTSANLASLPARPLSAEEQAAALRYLRQFHPKYRNLDWHSMLTLATGRFEAGYLHEDIFFGAIEPALNPPERQDAIANKNGYDRLGLPIRAPETVARIVRGRLVGAGYEPLTTAEVACRASEGRETEVVLKQALGSMEARRFASCRSTRCPTRSSRCSAGGAATTTGSFSAWSTSTRPSRPSTQRR